MWIIMDSAIAVCIGWESFERGLVQVDQIPFHLKAGQRHDRL